MRMRSINLVIIRLFNEHGKNYNINICNFLSGLVKNF